ncbi:Major facilitator superfamily transporter [Cordyceps militaris CM01]|uniref:Major facilitator superfamily transporter n=1 Tax=Cordyceps militaris (strain CM01) TaxID=983644 RepID=G3J6R1_CORMM|nr:Major facilitator superfamily transporter [Cordyceps militaris CM01]EGX95389.1 Major facilitator superfamily transporter [Cordyceps militaris CM01]
MSQTTGAREELSRERPDEELVPPQEAPPPEKETASAPNTAKGREIRGLRWLVICASIYITCFLYGLDTTIAADVQGPIIAAFGHVDQFSWIGAGFPLGSVCVILLLGTLYNTFDMKWVYVAAVLLFEVGSALCGAAPDMNALIVGRVIAGAGGSGIYLGSLQYFAVVTEDKERGLYMSLIAVFWGVGCVLGPLIGGAFATSAATWRWAFYINLVIGAVSAPAFLLYLPSICLMQGVSLRRRLASIDFLGFILGSGVWVSFLLVFTMAGAQWPWKDGRTIATFVVFGIVLIAYVLQQYFAILTTPSQRAFPGHLLRDRTQVLLYVVTAAGTTTLFVLVYYLPIYFQFVNDDGPLMAAVRLLPFVVIAVAVNLASGSLLHMIKRYNAIFFIASVFLLAGGGPLVTYLKPSTTTGTIYGLSILVAVGSGLSMVTGYTVSTLTTKPEDTGAGLKMQNVAQIGGQVIALAVAGQIYRSRALANLQSTLAGHSYSEADIAGLVAGTQSKLFETLPTELRLRAVDAIAQAMQMTFVLVPTAGAIMLITSLCMKREKLFGGGMVAVGG